MEELGRKKNYLWNWFSNTWFDEFLGLDFFLNFLVVHSLMRQKFFLPAIPNCESIILQNTLSISRILDTIIQCGNSNIASSVYIFFGRFEKSNTIIIGAKKCTAPNTTTFSKSLFGTHPVTDKRFRPEKPQPQSFSIMFDQKIMLGLMQIFTGRMTTLRSFDINWTKLNTSGFDPYVVVMCGFYIERAKNNF